MEGDDEEEEEGSLTEKSHDEAPESPSPITAGVYEEDEEEEETAPLAMSYEHTRRYWHTVWTKMGDMRAPPQPQH